MQREGDLWRHVDEALAQQQPHGLAGVTEDVLELLRHTVAGVLLALLHDQLLHLLDALHALHKAASDTRTVRSHTTPSAVTGL